MTSALPAPIAMLREARDRFAGLWRALDAVVARGGWWPPYMHLPSEMVALVLAGGVRISPEVAAEVAILAPLAAWRPTQGIYRFDPSLAEALDATDADREIPADILRGLPEWCVWIDLEGREVLGAPMAGFFARLDRLGERGDDELVLLLVDEDETRRDEPLQMYLPLVGSLVDAVERTARANARLGHGPDPTEGEIQRHARELAPLVARVLYLCSEAPDLLDPRRPGRAPERASLKHRRRAETRSCRPRSSRRPGRWAIASAPLSGALRRPRSATRGASSRTGGRRRSRTCGARTGISTGWAPTGAPSAAARCDGTPRPLSGSRTSTSSSRPCAPSRARRPHQEPEEPIDLGLGRTAGERRFEGHLHRPDGHAETGREFDRRGRSAELLRSRDRCCRLFHRRGI